MFDRTDLTPRERLLAAFEVIAPLYPFIAAAVETAREAGATNPEQLGEQTALLLDGASARTRVLNTETLPAAAVLIDTGRRGDSCARGDGTAPL